MKTNNKWTDKSVMGFAHVYAGSANSSHVDFPYSIEDYKGKGVREKIGQYKKDMATANEKLMRENKSLQIRVQRLETILKSTMAKRGYTVTRK